MDRLLKGILALFVFSYLFAAGIGLAAQTTTTKKSTTTAPAQVVHHKVKQGETLYSIATSYNTTVSAIQRANGKLAQLRPGMILLIRDTH